MGPFSFESELRDPEGTVPPDRGLRLQQDAMDADDLEVKLGSNMKLLCFCVAGCLLSTRGFPTLLADREYFHAI